MNLSKTKSFFFVIFLLFIFFCPINNTFAASAITCHCFKDRTYNPVDASATDNYILATSFNSFLAKSFDISKKQVVMLKMQQGVGQDDLLVGLKIAKVTGTDLQQLLSQRRKNQAWSKIVSSLPAAEKNSDDPFLKIIMSGIPVEEAGEKAADEIIAVFYGVPIEAIRQFRSSGLNEKEIALLLILAHAGATEPETLVARHKEEGTSWSEIAHNLGIAPAVAGKLMLQYPVKQIPE